MMGRVEQVAVAAVAVWLGVGVGVVVVQLVAPGWRWRRRRHERPQRPLTEPPRPIPDGRAPRASRDHHGRPERDDGPEHLVPPEQLADLARRARR